jgi:DNA replication protein DnaC
MKTTSRADAARIELQLTELRLPTMKLMWSKLADESDKEGWPAARFLAALTELELAERARRRFERNLAESQVPKDKTFSTFNFERVPMISKAQVMALASSDAWVEQGGNVLFFGRHGAGKSHLAAGLGHALLEKGRRVLFIRTRELIQQLQVANRELRLEAAIAKLDKFHLLVLDDISYVAKDQAEAGVLFELIAMRYERRSLAITANQAFGEWNNVFPDKAVTLAAIDRLVHHSVIFEMSVKSKRWEEALERQQAAAKAAKKKG